MASLAAPQGASWAGAAVVLASATGKESSQPASEVVLVVDGMAALHTVVVPSRVVTAATGADKAMHFPSAALVAELVVVAVVLLAHLGLSRGHSATDHYQINFYSGPPSKPLLHLRLLRTAPLTASS